MQVAGIIYSIDNGTALVRRICVADTVDRLAPVAQCAEGENLIIYDPSAIDFSDRGLPNLDDAYAIVESETGLPRGNTLCAVIDEATGDVTATIEADPSIDRIEGAVLYQHPDAAVGRELDEAGDFVSLEDEGA
jgi:hypothetical protein